MGSDQLSSFFARLKEAVKPTVYTLVEGTHSDKISCDCEPARWEFVAVSAASSEFENNNLINFIRNSAEEKKHET